MGCRASRTGARRSEAPTSGCSVRSSALYRAAGSTSIRPSAWSRSRASGGSASPGSKATAQVDATSRRSSRCVRATSSDDRAASSILSDDAAALSLTISVVAAPQWRRDVRDVDHQRRRLGLLARRLPTQPAGAGAGSGAVDGRWAMDQRVRPDPYTVDRAIASRSRTDAARHRTNGSVWSSPARPPSPSTAARSGDATSGGAATSRSSCDAVTDGRRSMQVGELLASGEIVLAPGRAVRHADGVRGILRPLA